MKSFKNKQFTRFMKQLLCCSLILCSFGTFSYVLASTNNCREDILMTYTNLEKAGFAEKLYITTKIESLLSDPKNDAYALSMPLLVSAQLGNKGLYRESLNRMNTAMEQIESGPFKAWLYGRILFATHSIKDGNGEFKTQSVLSGLLDGLIKDDLNRADRFTVWSLGYIAALNKTEFNKARDPMLAGANYLTDAYFKINSSTASEEKKQEARSDALWAWVMISQAAANANEKDSYQYAINQMLSITKQSSIGEALTKGLLRTAASNDYPAWAIGIVRLAAQTVGDETRYDELNEPLNKSTYEAKTGEKIQETLLAMVNAQLAFERENNIKQHCTVAKSRL